MNDHKKPLMILITTCLLVLSSCSTPQPRISSVTPGSPVQGIQATRTSLPAARASTLTPARTASAGDATEISAAADIKNGALAREYLEKIIREIGPRVSGSKEEVQAADYIQSAFKEMGYTVQRQAFSFTTENDETRNSANLIAVKKGDSPVEIVIGAHYDSSDEADGADDNASGVAVMLETAKKMKTANTPYTLRFIAFGAEENDMDGSRFYVNQLKESGVRNTKYMVNLDSLIAGDINYVYGDTGTPANMRDWMLDDARQSGFTLEAKTAQDMDQVDGSPCDCADFGPFQEAGIPFTYFEATNWNLGDEDGTTQVRLKFGDKGNIRHTKYDTIEYIDKTFPGRIDQNLSLYVTLLEHALTRYKLAK